MNAFRILILSLFVSLVGCASTVNDSVGDPNFHVGTLQQAVLVVALMDTSGTAFESLSQTTINTLAVNALRDSRRDLQAFNFNTLKTLFTEEEHASIAVAAARQFSTDADKALLARMAKAGDMVMFSRMLSDNTQSEESEAIVTVENNKQRRELTRTTWRDSVMQVDIYDANQQTLVWSAPIDVREQNDTVTERASGTFLENLAVDVLAAALVGGFPAAPTDQEMIQRLFKRLGGSLPQRSCRDIGFSACMQRTMRQS